MEVGVSGEHWPSGGVNAALHILSSFEKDHHLAIDIGAHEGETAVAIHKGIASLINQVPLIRRHDFIVGTDILIFHP